MIKRFHEAPKCIFNEVQKVTDGDYALVNLFAEDAEYYQMFEDAVAAGREVILDNGVFELGSAWDAAEFANWVEKLRPTYYIVPDVLENCAGTVASFFKFTNKFPNLPGKRIGVAQGEDYDLMVACYKAIEPYCDMVAVSFDFSWFQHPNSASSHYTQAMVGRRMMLQRMVDEGVINTSKPHHLLGVMLPQEVRYYTNPTQRGMFDWIYSIDTSNPVVHGLKRIRYMGHGLDTKESQKLYTMINAEVDAAQLDDVMHNIEVFRRFCNGK